MQYYIVSKTEKVNGNITHTYLGYVETEGDADIINNNYRADYDNWLQENSEDINDGVIEVSGYFNTNSVIECNIKTLIADGLTLITDLNNIT